MKWSIVLCSNRDIKDKDMEAIIDTSSLLALTRYYLPFDKNKTIAKFLEEQLHDKNIIILASVIHECKRVAKGKIIKDLPFIANKSNITENPIIAVDQKEFANYLENDFINQPSKNLLSEQQFREESNKF